MEGIFRVYGLFSSIFIIGACIVSNDKLKGLERKRSWPNSGIISGEGTLEKSSFRVSGLQCYRYTILLKFGVVSCGVLEGKLT